MFPVRLAELGIRTRSSHTGRWVGGNGGADATTSELAGRDSSDQQPGDVLEILALRRRTQPTLSGARQPNQAPCRRRRAGRPRAGLSAGGHARRRSVA
ncbi:hypothetical protein GCM10023321_14870 [Pseudonocardia eucalypti]|uniref:Uncharacterized protein n=1 Tax=Pseudonocardia eucalypti TaxID=648755 RepID=A0ABP9PPZ4_9PSEU